MAEKTAVADVSLGFSVELTKAQANALNVLVPGDGEPLQKVKVLANRVLRDLADGAMVLSPSVAARLKRDGLADQEQILAAAEKGVAMVDGRIELRWCPDPSWVTPLQAIADTLGVSVRQLFQNMLDHVISKGWIYDIRPERILVLTRDQVEKLEIATGKENFNSSDIVSALEAIL